MAQGVLKDCKKYVIHRIINPGSYLIIECENEKYYRKQIREFERLLENVVEKCTDAAEIFTGQVVAVKDKNSFHRGMVADIFNRSCKTIYWILLIDCGKTIEIHEENIYLIKNEELKGQATNIFEISVHGIQAATLDINYNKPTSGGIFHLRKSSAWSFSAFKFVENLFINNPCVFVKTISCNKRRISGEIYFIQKTDGKLVSLGQKLCDEGFAISCDALKFRNPNSKTGNYSSAIEEKIPKNALVSVCELPKTFMQIKYDK